jgi:hypothetical protein
MRNVMIYVHPERRFVEDSWGAESELLVKVQIDNSLDLGWRKEDIWLMTNFNFEHRGVKAIQVGGDTYCHFSPTATKINVIIRMFELGLIKDELYWFHDLDAFQLVPITEQEINLPEAHIGITDYGRSSINSGRDKRWSTGTIFFRKGSYDFFQLWQREIYRYKANEEITLLETLKKRKYSRIKRRVKKLNITYNLATRRRVVAETYEMAYKPLRVLHFHPFDKRPVEGEHDNVAVCVHGKNWMNQPLATPGLIQAFERHGVI